MMSLVPTRKRKGTHNAVQLARDKGKVRVIEQSGDDHSSGSAKNALGRSKLTTLRRGSIKIFSMFRTGKSTPSK
jgi:hypothetical protein